MGRDVAHSKTVFKLVAIATLAASMTAGEWQPVGPFGGSVLSIAADPQHLGVLLAGARNGLLFRSEDGAKSILPMQIITSLGFRVKTQAAWGFGSPAMADCTGGKRWLGWL